MITDIKEGELVEGHFVCVRKDRRVARNGSVYLALQLRDSSGKIEAKVFRDVDYIEQQFEKGDVIWVVARPQNYAGNLQLDIRTVRQAEKEDSALDFLPKAYRNLDELDGFFEHLANEVYDADLARLLTTVKNSSQLRAELRQAPCSKNGHHAYLGGLLEHTVAVATLSQQFCELHPRLNSDLLTAAALLHDIGKIREFSYGPEIEISEEGKLVGHLQIGHGIVRGLIADLNNFPQGKESALLHCIICHHGPQAAGLRDFASAEALALYRINALDAGVKGALE